MASMDFSGREAQTRTMLEPDPTDLIDVTALDTGDATVVTVSGDVDMQTAPVLAKALLDVVSRQPALVVVDLSGVEFLASRGLAVLVEAQEAAEGAGGRLCLAGGGHAVQRPLEATALDEIFDHYPTAEAALAEHTGAG